MTKHKGTNYRLSSLRGYIRLIHEVERVDPEAGKYLRKEAWEREDFSPVAFLSGCFVWRKTPQGHEYWRDLEKHVPGIYI